MYKKAIATALLLAFATPVFAQTATPQPLKPDPAELRKEAVAFLRETMGDVQNLRTLENRISFSAELAGLMWYHDEHEARTMFNAAISDFRELISRLDAQMMAMPEDAEMDGVGIFTEGSDRRKFEMKYRVAMAVRQQIATSIAEHDPDVALSFFYDTASTNPKQQIGIGSDSYFEFNLLGQIAAKDPAKATKMGARPGSGRIESHHVALLKQIYDKDAGSGVEFGGILLNRLKSEKPDDRNLAVLESLIEYGGDRLAASKGAGAKAPVYGISEIREITELLANSLLSLPEEEGAVGNVYIFVVQKYLPGRAAQIRAKFRRTMGASYLNPAGNTANISSNVISPSRPGMPAANANADYVGETTVPPVSEVNPKQGDEEKLLENIGKIGKGELPKQEREKVVAQSRKILMQSRGKDKQIMGLSMLASQVARAGDKQLAAEIMRDAESLVNPQPKNYQDFMYTWMLASGYAEADPDKAFPILESAIGRANDLIAAFVKVGEFIDVTEEMISDGEAQVGAFGGGMIRGLSKELGVAEATLIILVRADFGKTRALTNRFERPEVRILAKMLVLRSVLGKKPEAPADEQVKKVMGQKLIRDLSEYSPRSR